MHILAKFIYFKILGWKLVGTFPQVYQLGRFLFGTFDKEGFE